MLSTPVCLLPMIDARIWQLFRLYRYYDKGNLYRGGGIMDQPNKYIEAMEIIHGALNG